jgi:zinc transporter 9
MATGKGSTFRVVLMAVVGNGAITIAKFVGWLMTASPSMLAEAIHSAADTSNQILLLVGIRHGRSGPSPEFPWGRHSARYLWNLISAVGIFFVGFGVTTYHGVHSLLEPQHVHADDSFWIPIGILVFAFVVEGYVLLAAVQDVRRKKGERGLFEYLRYGDDPTPVAVMLEDGVAVLGVVLALVGFWLARLYGTTLPDAITAIIIGVLLGVMALVLGYANGRLLIRAATHPADQREIRAFVEALPYVERLASLKTEVMGPDRIRLTMEIEFHGEQLIDRTQITRDAEEIRGGKDPLPILVDTAERMVRVVGREVNDLERRIQERFPQVAIIELEVA